MGQANKDFADVSARFKKKRDETAPPAPEKRDYEEIHLLRARILGLLIRDARQARSKTQAELATELRIDPELLEAWELGQTAPALPELEMLAYGLNLPVSHFWRNQTVTERDAEHELNLAPDEYLALRNRVIGVRLAVARKEARLSHEELAAKLDLAPETIMAYEMGHEAAPFPVLNSLGAVLRKSVSYFIENAGRLGGWLRLQEEYERFTELPEDVRAFVSQPVNQPFIEIAMRLSKLPLNDLRTVGENILDITL